MVLVILGRVPVRITPSSMDQHSPALKLFCSKESLVNRQTLLEVRPNDDSIQVSETFEIDFRKVFAVSVAMEGAIDISSSVRDHFDLADLKLCPFFIVFPGLFAAQVITNDWRGQAFIGH